MNNLPIDDVIPQVRSALREHACLVLQAPPGAGKTTRLPLALIDENWLDGQKIIILEPRRLAARSAAMFMASELGEEVGKRIGYRVRFENRISKSTRIEVVTEGILTRRLQDDPMLEGVGLVIFDEFHERNLNSDLALALCFDAQRSLRDDLKLLIMSATLDGRMLAQRFDSPLVVSEGRSHPVDIHYLRGNRKESLAFLVQQAVVRAVDEEQGDMLIFLPGIREIRETLALLEKEPACSDMALYALYGDLPLSEQQKVLQPDRAGKRKIVVATSIAETSLTIEGVSIVIDSGWMRSPRFNPRSGLGRLETVRVSRASAEQRAGRAGRQGPGVCYRLWNESVQKGLIPFSPPEISVSDLAPLALQLALWGVTNPSELEWIDTPPESSYQQAITLLIQLGALDESGLITPMGREMASTPLHPRLSHMLVKGQELGAFDLACDLAALLSERDILVMSDHPGRCDLMLRLELMARFRSRGGSAARQQGADPGRCAAVDRVAGQLGRGSAKAEAPSDAVAGVLLASAYPDRIARMREGGDGRYLLSGGRGASLSDECRLRGYPWLAVGELDGAGKEGWIRLALPFDSDTITEHFAHLLHDADRVEWDGASKGVIAQREKRLGDLLLESRPLESPDPELILKMVLATIRSGGMELLPWGDEVRQFQQRVALLKEQFPDQEWPDLSDNALQNSLEQWLAPYLNGISRAEQLKKLNLPSILKGMLSWEQQQKLEEGAPTHLLVPSGSNKRIKYGEDGPVLAVKLQEMFGMEQSPRVAWGKVPVTLHLLSPAQRPIQVTRDLHSFWEHTYHEVKKELKGRYPKHPWPDDPYNAVATARTNRKRQDK